MSWGKKHAAATNDARSASHTVRVDNQNGKKVDKSIQAKGEAITRKADLKEAAKNERKSR